MNRESGSIKAWVLAFILASGLGFGALIGIGCAIGANACPFQERTPETSTDGREIFLRNCAVCHGIEAEGARGPSLVSGAPATYTLAELEAKISRGRPLAGMPRFRNELSEEQIRAVAEAIITLREES
ncbi:MAG: c-type cytochrome [Actinomycetota bacterium]